MLDIGIQEIVILMVLALLVFGPDKLPELGRRLGRAMREFRRASDEFRTTIETNLNLSDEGSLLSPAAGTLPSDSAPASDPALQPSAAPVSEAAAAGSPDPAPAEPPPPTIIPADPFCAQRGGRLLHRSGCAWAARIAEADRIALKTAAEGTEIGLAPCPVCDPVAAETA
jgi:TatA/E family protein of Tat protein translocase